MPKASIRRRLIVSVLVTQLILTVGLVSFATYLTGHHLRKAFEARLRNRAMSLSAAVRYSEDPKPVLTFYGNSAPPPVDKRYPDLYFISDQDGRVLGTSPNWREDMVNQLSSDHHYSSVIVGDTHYLAIRLEGLPVLDQEEPGVASTETLTIIYAAPTTDLRQDVWSVALLTLAGSAILLTLATLAAVWAIRKGLSPLSALADGAQAVSASNWRLDAPPSATNTEELAPLVTAMDTMLGTLHRAFTSQRDFLANAAHELKTPLAVLKSTLQSLQQRPRTAEEYRTAMDGAMEDVERLEKLIHSMLRLARAEQAAMNGAKKNCPPLDLNASCEQAIVRLRSLAEANGITVELAASTEDSLVAADPEDLDLVWSNLLENAIRYSDRGMRVVISVGTHDGDAVVTVRDWGAGIPEADLPYVFDRFHRADTSRTRATGGYGLGLAIAKAMAESYSGSIAVQSATGTGTTMSVRLPRIRNGLSNRVIE